MKFRSVFLSFGVAAILFISGQAYGQELTGDPAGGPDESEIEAAEAKIPVTSADLPAPMNTEVLNKFYSSWDTMYVRKYSEASPDNKSDYNLTLLSAQSSAFTCPVEGEFLSPFGYRGRRIHAGVDIRLNAGDPVGAAFDGVVRMARYYSGYGNCVVIRHFNGLETLYGHLSKILVAVNQFVNAGDVVGLGGRTGRATCNHLHFETRFKGKPFNPKQLIDFNTFSLIRDTLNINNSTFGLSRDYLPGTSNSNIALADDAAPLKVIAKTEKAKSKKYHTVRSGETLSSISNRYGTTVKAICSINGMKQSKTLRPGTKLRIK